MKVYKGLSKDIATNELGKIMSGLGIIIGIGFIALSSLPFFGFAKYLGIIIIILDIISIVSLVNTSNKMKNTKITEVVLNEEDICIVYLESSKVIKYTDINSIESTRYIIKLTTSRGSINIFQIENLEDCYNEIKNKIDNIKTDA